MSRVPANRRRSPNYMCPISRKRNRSLFGTLDPDYLIYPIAPAEFPQAPQITSSNPPPPPRLPASPANAVDEANSDDMAIL